MWWGWQTMQQPSLSSPPPPDAQVDAVIGLHAYHAGLHMIEHPSLPSILILGRLMARGGRRGRILPHMCGLGCVWVCFH
jgi:hypothetical protein